MGNPLDYRSVFIIGSGRSGSTILGKILDLHPQICTWFHAFFLMDRYFRNAANDCRTKTDATEAVIESTRNAFEYYRAKRGGQIIVSHFPINSFKIPFLNEIFPDAKFIHLLRDGRDTTLSIHKEWLFTQRIVQEKRFHDIIDKVAELLNDQPLLAHKIGAFNFEVGQALLGRGFLHRIRWNGRVGWGPRFEGWEDVVDQITTLEFNALQWRKSVETVLREKLCLSLGEERFLEIRYEKFLSQPGESLTEIFKFLQLPFPDDFISRLPAIKTLNFGKWKTEFTDDEKKQIGPILNPLLLELNYSSDNCWYEN